MTSATTSVPGLRGSMPRERAAIREFPSPRERKKQRHPRGPGQPHGDRGSVREPGCGVQGRRTLGPPSSVRECHVTLGHTLTQLTPEHHGHKSRCSEFYPRQQKTNRVAILTSLLLPTPAPRRDQPLARSRVRGAKRQDVTIQTRRRQSGQASSHVWAGSTRVVPRVCRHSWNSVPTLGLGLYSIVVRTCLPQLDTCLKVYHFRVIDHFRPSFPGHQSRFCFSRTPTGPIHSCLMPTTPANPSHGLLPLHSAGASWLVRGLARSDPSRLLPAPTASWHRRKKPTRFSLRAKPVSASKFVHFPRKPLAGHDPCRH